jgi:hypothetical protein
MKSGWRSSISTSRASKARSRPFEATRRVGSKVAGSTPDRDAPSNGTARSRTRITFRSKSCTPVVWCTRRTISARAQARLVAATSSTTAHRERGFSAGQFNPQEYGMDAVADLSDGVDSNNDRRPRGSVMSRFGISREELAGISGTWHVERTRVAGLASTGFNVRAPAATSWRLSVTAPGRPRTPPTQSGTE